MSNKLINVLIKGWLPPNPKYNFYRLWFLWTESQKKNSLTLYNTTAENSAFRQKCYLNPQKQSRVNKWDHITHRVLSARVYQIFNRKKWSPFPAELVSDVYTLILKKYNWPGPDYTPVVPGSHHHSGQLSCCQCHKFQTSVSELLQRSNRWQTFWKTWGWGSSALVQSVPPVRKPC